MDFFKNQLDLESLKKFVREKILPETGYREENKIFPLEIYRSLHEMGYLQCVVPEELGGVQAKTSDLIAIAREIAYGSAGIAVSFAAHIIGTLPVFLYASKELKQKLAQHCLNEFSLASFCWTEPNSGSDVFKIETKAVQTHQGYFLTGHKCFITNASYATHFLVMAKVETLDSKKSLTLFYVPKSTPGITIGNTLKKMGQWDSNTSEVYLENVFVPENHVIGEVGKGPEIALHCLQRNRCVVAASAIGVCDRAWDITKKHLLTCVRYGKPLLTQPTIQSFLANLYTKIQASWHLVHHAAFLWDQGKKDSTPSSMAKLYAGNVATEFTSEALELLGGYGYCREYEIERLYRDAKLFEILEGPSFVQQALIAKELFSELKTLGSSASQKLAA